MAITEARRARFVDAFIANGQNYVQAARDIGVANKRAATFAATMSHDERTQAMIGERLAELAKPHALRAEEVVASLARAIRFDPRRLFNEDGTLKKIHEIDEDTALELAGHELEIIQRVGKTIISTAKVKYPNKATARDQGMKYFGLYASDNAQRNTDPAETAAKVRDLLKNIDKKTGGK